MQKKLAASFLFVALLYLVVHLVVPVLQPDPVWSTVLTVSLDIMIGLGAAWGLSHVLTRRIRELAAASAVISGGDLTRRITTRGTDETAELARSFAVMLESLLGVVLEVQDTSEKVNASAQSLSVSAAEMNATTEEISGTARAIRDGADEQAGRIEETAEATRRLTGSVAVVADGAREVFKAASEASHRAAAGADEARATATSIAQLSERTAAVAQTVDGFRTRAGEIGKIVTFISSISHQTHMLAINAAIEAVRAGKEGRGFAVVAEEVSRLADDVREFAEQIYHISDEILQGSGSVAEGIRDSVDAADEVRDLVDRSATSFEGILTAIHGTTAIAEQIAGRTEDQQRAAADVSSALDRISSIVSQNTREIALASAATHEQHVSMKEMTASAEALARTSDHLREVISIFRVR